MNKISTTNSVNLKDDKHQHRVTPSCMTKCSDWKLFTTIFVNKDSFSLV